MKQEYSIRSTERLSDEARTRWSALLAGRDFGEITVAWCEAIQDSRPENLEIHFLEAYDGREPKALVILHILRKLDLSGYMGKAVQRGFGYLGKLGLRPLRKDIAFLEIPLGNLSGILFAPGAESHSREIAAAVTEYVRREFRYDILCLKSSPEAPGEGAFGELGMLDTGFIANMSLPLAGFESYDAYVKTLRPRIRTETRTFKRLYSEAGGSIELVREPTQEQLAEIAALYQRTVDYHDDAGDLQVPIPVGRAFFEALFAKLPRERRRLFLARLQDKTVGFALTVDSGDSLCFTHCGLDYERSVPSRAYFNLYYAMIEFAISRRYAAFEMGAEAYEVKRKLGGRPYPTRYHFEVTHPLLSTVAKFVARNFSAQEGSELSAKSPLATQ